MRYVEGKRLPKWFGELYLERHRGTYTSMAKNKNYNRRSEFLLQTVEGMSLTKKLLTGAAYPKQALYADWTTVLLNQFHDIIPGSSIPEVYEDSTAQYEALLKENLARRDRAFQAPADQCAEKGVLVYNPTGVCRDGMIQVAGQPAFVKDVPAWGWKVVRPEMLKDSGEAPKATPTHMENRFYSIELDETGCLTGIYDKINCRQVLTGRANVLEAFDDHPRNCDNWEISNYYTEKKWEINDVQSLHVEQDAQTARVVIRRRFLHSTLEQTITIYRERPGIDFSLCADWHEHHIFLKTAFPVDILSDKATYEIQYGAVERPAHQNTSWDAAKFEVCAQKWADYAEAGYGVALLNNNTYGYAIHDGVMRLSLIKCGTYPNPQADQGEHHTRYCLLPHAGDWREAVLPMRTTARLRRRSVRAAGCFASARTEKPFGGSNFSGRERLWTAQKFWPISGSAAMARSRGTSRMKPRSCRGTFWRIPREKRSASVCRPGRPASAGGRSGKTGFPFMRTSPAVRMPCC